MPYRTVEFRIKSTQVWVPQELRQPLDEDAVRFWSLGKNSTVLFDYNDVAGPPWNDNKLNAAKAIIQTEHLDVRTLRSDLPDWDPMKWTDPGLAVWFWDGDYLVERHWTIDFLTWDNQAGLGFQITAVTD